MSESRVLWLELIVYDISASRVLEAMYSQVRGMFTEYRSQGR